MAQMGEGFWINPENDKFVEVTKHELAAGDFALMRKLGVDEDYQKAFAVDKQFSDLVSAFGRNNPKKNKLWEHKMRLGAMILGLIRIRIYSDHVGVQFYADNDMNDFGNPVFTETIEDLKKIGIEEPVQSNPSWMLGQAKYVMATKMNIHKFTGSKIIIENLGKEGHRAVINSDTFFDSKGSELNQLMRQQFVESMEEEVDETFGRDMAALFEDNAFKLGKELNNITESQRSLSRLYKHMTDPAVFGIITAYRGEYQNETDSKGRRNKKRQEELINRMKSLGYGVFKLYGAWNEGGGVGKEESLLWYPIDKSDPEASGKEIKDLTMAWAKEFEQDGAIYRDIPDANAPVMLYRHKEVDWDSGKETIVNDHIKVGKGYKVSDDISGNEGKLYMNVMKKDLGDAWSTLKKGSPNRRFVFESTEEI